MCYNHPLVQERLHENNKFTKRQLAFHTQICLQYFHSIQSIDKYFLCLTLYTSHTYINRINFKQIFQVSLFTCFIFQVEIQREFFI